MLHEWLPLAPEERRRQADEFQMLAVDVARSGAANRLGGQAAAPFAKTELREFLSCDHRAMVRPVLRLARPSP
jgi:hypothetical protein